MHFTRITTGILLVFLLLAGTGLAAEPAQVEKFVKARIDIGEMMMNYFSGGRSYGGDGQRPSPEAMREMGADINTKLSALLAKYDLTIEEYRQLSPEVFADHGAVKNFLNDHPDLKERYEDIPLVRMGGSLSGQSY